MLLLISTGLDEAGFLVPSTQIINLKFFRKKFSLPILVLRNTAKPKSL
jgi:hypothetical protein